MQLHSLRIKYHTPMTKEFSVVEKTFFFPMKFDLSTFKKEALRRRPMSTEE